MSAYIHFKKGTTAKTTTQRTDLHIRQLERMIDALLEHYPDPAPMPGYIRRKIDDSRQQLRFWKAHHHYLIHKYPAERRD